MIRVLTPGVALAALLATAATAAPTPPSIGGSSWFIIPGDDACRTDIELVGRTGASAPAALVSDGQRLVLRFTKENVPERAFLPIRIDQKPYSNLVMRGEPAGIGELELSEATQAAMRKGATLQIAWLTNEPVSASLSGSEQGVPDLRTCGAQVATQHRERLVADRQAQERADADARAKAIADAQVEAARAQQAAADAERQRLANDEAQRRWAEQEAQREQSYRQAEQDRLYQQAERERAYYQQAERQRAYGYAPQPRYEAQDDGYYAPRPPPAWGYRPY